MKVPKAEMSMEDVRVGVNTKKMITHRVENFSVDIHIYVLQVPNHARRKQLHFCVFRLRVLCYSCHK